MIQSGFLAAYPATYQDRDTAALFLLCIPVLVYWIYCLCTEASLLRMFYTWGLYLVVFLLPMIATIFAVAGDDLDKTKFLGPNTLKVILCLTPVLFLFLRNTASGLSESDDYWQLAFRLTIQVTIDLFDAVEMLDIVLNENENSHGIPKWFGRLMVALACFSFLLSLLQMAENKLDDGIVEQRKCLAIIRNLVQMALSVTWCQFRVYGNSSGYLFQVQERGVNLHREEWDRYVLFRVGDILDLPKSAKSAGWWSLIFDREPVTDFRHVRNLVF